MKIKNAYFFSIIIPTRKLNTYLTDETLPAIQKLRYKNFEVIIIADNNRGFRVLMEKYSWLKIIKNTSMPGIKRDIGVKKSRGDIVVFIDDDAYPPTEWLSILNDIFQEKKDLVAVGGPGILPKKVNTWEKIFDLVMQSFIGSGGFSYRFMKGRKQFVDDFPSMNLSFRKNVFVKLGGFKNKYWPGEDSKLINALINKEKKQIYYDPQTFIYHHRRDNLLGYLKQHRNYGCMRGMFAAHGDTNSKRFTYTIPTTFTLYIVTIIILSLTAGFIPIEQSIVKISMLPLMVYAIMIISVGVATFLKTLHLGIAFGTTLVLPLTHVVYGISFLKGYLSGKTT